MARRAHSAYKQNGMVGRGVREGRGGAGRGTGERRVKMILFSLVLYVCPVQPGAVWNMAGHGGSAKHINNDEYQSHDVEGASIGTWFVTCPYLLDHSSAPALARRPSPLRSALPCPALPWPATSCSASHRVKWTRGNGMAISRGDGAAHLSNQPSRVTASVEASVNS